MSVKLTQTHKSQNLAMSAALPMESTLTKSQRNMRANQMWARQQAPAHSHPSKPGRAINRDMVRPRLRTENIPVARQIFAAMFWIW